MLTAWIRFSARFANRANAIATRPQRIVKHFEAATRWASVASRRTRYAVEVDGGRRRQRVELGGLRRQRGGEEGRDQEPDQPVRQVPQDEGDEDVVGVVGLRPRVGRDQRRLRLGADRLALRGALRGPGARAALAARTSPECRASSQASISRRFRGVGLAEPLLERVQPVAGVAAKRPLPRPPR